MFDHGQCTQLATIAAPSNPGKIITCLDMLHRCTPFEEIACAMTATAVPMGPIWEIQKQFPGP